MQKMNLFRSLFIVKALATIVTGFVAVSFGGWLWVLFALSLIGTVAVAYTIERESERRYRRLAWELYDLNVEFGGDIPQPPFKRPSN